VRTDPKSHPRAWISHRPPKGQVITRSTGVIPGVRGRPAIQYSLNTVQLGDLGSENSNSPQGTTSSIARRLLDSSATAALIFGPFSVSIVTDEGVLPLKSS
jgi:hypothetical protein